MMRVENYRELVHEDIELAANASDSSLQDEFLLSLLNLVPMWST